MTKYTPNKCVDREYSTNGTKNLEYNMSEYGWMWIGVKNGNYLVTSYDVRMYVFLKDKFSVLSHFYDGTERYVSVEYISDTSIKLTVRNCDYVYISLHNYSLLI